MIPPQLVTDVDALREEGQDVEVVEDGTRFYVILKGFRLPDNVYAPTLTDLMVIADYQYPVSKLDMYWTDPQVRLVTGALPQSADQFEACAGRQWQRWSWHYPVWDPSRHNLRTHVEVFRDRLARGN
jgi:hypothetical protein